jgi:serine protease Do
MNHSNSHETAPGRMRKLRSQNCQAALAAGLLLTSPGLQAQPDTSALATARQLNEAFIQVADRVSPAVVIIEIAHRPDYLDTEQEPNPMLEMLPPELRRQFEERSEKKRQERPPHRPPVFDGHGSGIVIREDGWILTNDHVVEGAEKIRVRFKDGTSYDADGKWWTDPQSDIAVIKVPARGLTTAKLGDSSKTRVGEFAIAIGAPFELDYSVTFGHVSAKGRTHIIDTVPGAAMDQDFVQTDASINPGNSGGPLVNIEGEVIGVNTLIRGMNRGIGFAVPSNLASQVAEHLIAEGKFARAWLGVQISALKEDADFRDLVPGIDDGVIVKKIMPGGPASRSGHKPADLIVSVDGRQVSSAQQLRNEIRAKRIGSQLLLAVVRPESAGKTRQLQLSLQTEEWPEETAVATPQARSAESSSPGGLGITVQPLTKNLADKFGVVMSDGVIVTAVQQDSLAERQGIKAGDIITEVDHQPVHNPKQFRDTVKGAGAKPILLHLISDGAPEFRILKDRGD